MNIARILVFQKVSNFAPKINFFFNTNANESFMFERNLIISVEQVK